MKTAKDPSVIYQVKRAFKSGNRLATFVGLMLGGFVPLASYVIAHSETGAFDFSHARSISIVAGALLYSAKTVYEWARMAFVSVLKSVGFVFLTEAVMISSTTHWLTIAALCYLISINAIATGCNLSLGVRK